MSLESTQKHLARFGFTIEHARDFIHGNITNPKLIFDTAKEYGVTTEMLRDISEHPVDVVNAYFTGVGLITKELDYTNILINSNLGSLESLVTFNGREGLLSNTSLRDLVSRKLDISDDYENFFLPIKEYQDDDGIYDAEELGVSSLTNVPANAGSLESIFYGTLINIFSQLEDAELSQLNSFPDKQGQEYQLLLAANLTSPSAVLRDDTNLTNLVVEEAANTIKYYWLGNDPDTGETQYQNGIFDFGLLGNI